MATRYEKCLKRKVRAAQMLGTQAGTLAKWKRQAEVAGGYKIINGIKVRMLCYQSRTTTSLVADLCINPRCYQ